jgi:hypothetical protein
MLEHDRSFAFNVGLRSNNVSPPNIVVVELDQIETAERYAHTGEGDHAVRRMETT